MDTKFVTRQVSTSSEVIKGWCAVMLRRALAKYSNLHLPDGMTFSPVGTLTITNADKSAVLVHVRVIALGAQRSRVEFQWVNAVHESMKMLLAELFNEFPEVKAEVLARPDVQAEQENQAAPVAEPDASKMLREEERRWYKTLLECKDAYGNGAMTWQQIADRQGVSAKTAKRKLRELQARQLPGLDDWPDRVN